MYQDKIKYFIFQKNIFLYLVHVLAAQFSLFRYGRKFSSRLNKAQLVKHRNNFGNVDIVSPLLLRDV